jgi:hypothetical protein
MLEKKIQLESSQVQFGKRHMMMFPIQKRLLLLGTGLLGGLGDLSALAGSYRKKKRLAN